MPVNFSFFFKERKIRKKVLCGLVTVPLPPVDQPPNCAMFQPSGSSNRSANSNNNRRLTRGLGTSHFSSIAFLSLFFGLVPRLLCGRSTDRVSGRHVAHNFFFFFSFFISLQVARFGWSSLRWPALHFLQDSIDTARRGQHYRSIPE